MTLIPSTITNKIWQKQNNLVRKRNNEFQMQLKPQVCVILQLSIRHNSVIPYHIQLVISQVLGFNQSTCKLEMCSYNYSVHFPTYGIDTKTNQIIVRLCNWHVICNWCVPADISIYALHLLKNLQHSWVCTINLLINMNQPCIYLFDSRPAVYGVRAFTINSF